MLIQETGSRQPSLAPKRRKRNLVSLTPLIDVVFILLVFFMLASNFHDWRSIALNTVEKAGGAPNLNGAMMIDIRPQDVRLSGESLSVADLTQKVTERLSVKPDQRILLRPLDGVPLQRAISVLDRLSAAGAIDISFINNGKNNGQNK